MDHVIFLKNSRNSSGRNTLRILD